VGKPNGNIIYRNYLPEEQEDAVEDETQQKVLKNIEE